MKSNSARSVAVKGRRRRTLARSLVVPVAAGIGFFSAGSAFAGYDCVAHGNGATATFENNGELLRITDDSADGHSAVARINYGDGTKIYWNPDGAGPTRTVNLSIAEGTRVEAAACTGECSGYRIIECSLYRVGKA